jgi:hypothetical protein
MYVGSVSGGRDIGRVRVRSATSTIITLGRNNHIKWLDNLFLTVVDFIEPQAVFSKITTDEVTGSATSWFKDDTITYTDQNSKMDPVVLMGAHQALFKGESIDWHSSGTFSPVGASLSTYSWTINKGSSVVSSSAAHPGPQTYPTAGNFKTTLAVTDSNGKTFIGSRYVHIKDSPEAQPQSWGIESIEGDREQGGWRVNMWVRSSEVAGLKEGGLIFVWAEDWYNGVKLPIPDNSIFVGYLQDKSIYYNWYESKVSFTALSVTGIAGLRETFGWALDECAVGNDDQWYKMPNITVDKALIHYLRWQTTIMHIADFTQTGGTRLKSGADFARGPIYGMAQTYLQANLLASMVANRKGQLYCEVDINYVPSGSRIYPTALNMERGDWRGQPEINRTLAQPLSYAELGGVAWSGIVTGTFAACLAGAPGVVPSFQGTPQTLNNLNISGQEQINQLAGDYYADANSEFSRITFPMAGHYRFIDIAPQERVAVDLAAADNWDELVWNDKLFIPQAIQHQYLSDKHVLLSDITFKEETSGFPGDTIIIPVEPPDGGGDPPPTIDPPPPPEAPDIMYVAYSGKVLRTRNFSSASPTWEVIFTTGSIHSFILDPWDPGNSAWVLVNLPTAVYYCGNLNSATPTFSVVLNSAISTAQTGIDLDDAKQLHASIHQQGRIYLIGRPGGIPRVWTSTNYGTNWSVGASFGSNIPYQSIEASDHNVGVIFATGNGNDTYKSSNHGATWTLAFNWVIDNTSWSSSQVFLPYDGNTSDQVILIAGGFGSPAEAAFIAKSTDGGATGVDISPVILGVPWGGGYNGSHYAMTGNLTNLYLLGYTGTTVDQTSVPKLFYSTDGGSTWAVQFTFTKLGDGVGDGAYGALGLWPYDSRMVFILSNDTGGPLVSFDRGLTWNGRSGNMEALLGTTIELGAGYPVSMVPVWVTV